MVARVIRGKNWRRRGRTIALASDRTERILDISIIFLDDSSLRIRANYLFVPFVEETTRFARVVKDFRLTFSDALERHSVSDSFRK